MKLLLHSNISLLILLAFTLKEPEPFRVRLNIQRHGDLTIVDSTGLSKELKFYRREEPVAYYPIFYLGKRSNMLSLGRNPISPWISAEPYNYGKLRNWELSYSGQRKVLCRLRFTRFDNEIYSNIFYDWVDDSML